MGRNGAMKRNHWRKIVFFLFGVIWGLEWTNTFKPSLRSRLLYGLLKIFYRRQIPADIQEQRGYLDKMQELVPAPLKVEPVIVDADGVACEWVLPADEIPTQVVFYCHGGAYVTRMPLLHRTFLHKLAKESKAQFLMVDYRLAPEFPFPAALADALTAYRWLLAQGWDPQQVLVAGDSAGGGLTAALLLALRDLNLPLPVGAILLSPWTDLSGSGESIRSLADEDVMLNWDNLQECALDYAGGESLTHPWVSPLFGDFHGLPDTLILAGGAEILLDDSLRLAERMQEDGVKVELYVEPHMGHVYPAYAAIPEAQKAVRMIADTIARC
jgi:acetyl esterase/lipase